MATCKGCGLPGTLARRGKGWVFLEPGGARHRCKSYRPKKKPREPAHSVGPTTPRTDFSLPGCATCTQSPWEDCPCVLEARFSRVMDLAEQA